MTAALRHAAAGVAASAALALSGCGQKGPLYLPEKPGAVVTSPAATPPAPPPPPSAPGQPPQPPPAAEPQSTPEPAPTSSTPAPAKKSDQDKDSQSPH
jgi:predicted small lipoprotein YifL